MLESKSCGTRLRDKRQLNRLAYGDVQRVDLVLASGCSASTSTAADDVDVHGVGGRRVDAEIKQRPPYEHDEKEAQGDDGPCGFKNR